MHAWFELKHNIVCGIEKYPGVEIRSWTSNRHQTARTRTWAMCYLLWLILNQTDRVITILCYIACWPLPRCLLCHHGMPASRTLCRCPPGSVLVTRLAVLAVGSMWWQRPCALLDRVAWYVGKAIDWSLSFGNLWHGGQRYGYDRQVNLVISRSSGHLQPW